MSQSTSNPMSEQEALHILDLWANDTNYTGTASVDIEMLRTLHKIMQELMYQHSFRYGEDKGR